MYELGTLGNRDNIPKYGIELDDGSLLSGLDVNENIHTMIEEYGFTGILIKTIMIDSNLMLMIFLVAEQPLFVVTDSDGNFISKYTDLIKNQYDSIKSELNINYDSRYPRNTIYPIYENDMCIRLECLGYLGDDYNIVSYIDIAGSNLSVSDEYYVKQDTNNRISYTVKTNICEIYNQNQNNEYKLFISYGLSMYKIDNNELILKSCGMSVSDGNLTGGIHVKDNYIFVFYEDNVYVHIYNTGSDFNEDNYIGQIHHNYNDIVGDLSYESQELYCSVAHMYNDNSFILGLINKNNDRDFFAKLDIEYKYEQGVEYYDLEYNGVILDEANFQDEARRFYDYYYPSHLDSVNCKIYFIPFLLAYLNQNNVVRNDVMFFNTFILSGDNVSGQDDYKNASVTLALVGVKIENDSLSVEWIDMSYATSGENDVGKRVIGFNMIGNKIYTQEFIGKNNTDDPDVGKIGVYDVKDAILPLECGNKYIREHGSDLGDPYEK